MSKGGGGGEEKNIFPPNPSPYPASVYLSTNPLLVKDPVTIQDGAIEPIYLAFHIPLLHVNNAYTAG